MTIEVLNKSGIATGRSVEFSSELTKAPNEHTVYLAVKQYLANNRQGTHKTKGRSEIAGSTRKLHKQKGTGGARKGDIKNPLYHGGGRIFGPQPRDYSQDLNKKVKREARRSAIASKLNANRFIIVEDFNLDNPATKEIVAMFKALKAEKKPLLVTTEMNKNVYLSARNIETANISNMDELNTYQIINSGTVVMFEGAAKRLVEAFS